MEKNPKYTSQIKKFLKTWEKNPYLLFLKKFQKIHPGAKAYLVGGLVRDIMLGRESNDYDLVITGVPAKKLFQTLQKLGTVNLVGKTFGVYKFLPKNIKPSFLPLPSAGEGQGVRGDIDIALPRTEHSFGTGGYRDVDVTSDCALPIEKDLERRDFTINAMALVLESGIRNQELGIIDPFGGLKDLENKLIRCVGSSDERFKEDYSRMLRALRFSVQLDFEIEKNTWQAILKNVHKINSSHPHPSRQVVGTPSPCLAGRQAVQGEGRLPSPRAGEGAPSHEERVRGNNFIISREIIAKELIKMFLADPIKSLEILDESSMLKILMPEFLKIKNCSQPKQFHSEGDVWAHTLLALNFLDSKKFKQEFSISNLPRRQEGFQFPMKESLRNNSFKIQNSKFKIPAELVWALVFHDLGKPYTMTKTDRIRFNEHDTFGAKLFGEIAERLKLASAGLDTEKVKTLIEKHMLLTHGKISDMKETTIEKYFFNEQFPGTELLMVSFADISATVPPSGKPDFTKYNEMKKRILGLKKKMKTKKNLPKDILDGNEIMKILKIPPGKKVGEIKNYLRELQLKGRVKTKQGAKEALLKQFK